jgi:CRP/FNR family transcriptional regulator, anaerobic regulatory protein
MTSGVKTEEQVTFKTGAPCSACRTLGVPCAIESHATSVRTRRGQTLALARDTGENAFIVRDGVLTLQVTLPGRPRQIVGIYFPGDMLRAHFAPPQAGAALVPASAGEVWRLRAAALDTLAAADSKVRRYLDDAIAGRMTRQALHAVALGQFDCEQRVASLLVELALRTGLRAPGGGIAIEMPLSRTDIADYLGLNPDTLSRIMSRLRASGLVGHAKRSRAVIRDFAALAARCPTAAALIEVSGTQRLESLLGAAL